MPRLVKDIGPQEARLSQRSDLGVAVPAQQARVAQGQPDPLPRPPHRLPVRTQPPLPPGLSPAPGCSPERNEPRQRRSLRRSAIPARLLLRQRPQRRRDHGRDRAGSAGSRPYPHHHLAAHRRSDAGAAGAPLSSGHCADGPGGPGRLGPERADHRQAPADGEGQPPLDRPPAGPPDRGSRPQRNGQEPLQPGPGLRRPHRGRHPAAR